jgi:hypothetical protein
MVISSWQASPGRGKVGANASFSLDRRTFVGLASVVAAQGWVSAHVQADVSPLQAFNVVQAALVPQLGHAGVIYDAAISPDSRWFVTGGEDTAKLWEAASGRTCPRADSSDAMPMKKVPRSRRRRMAASSL